MERVNSETAYSDVFCEKWPGYGDYASFMYQWNIQSFTYHSECVMSYVMFVGPSARLLVTFWLIHSFILFNIHICYNSNTWTSRNIQHIISRIHLPIGTKD
jgi:hypothetical protein